MAYSEETKESLKERMPEVLRYYGIADTRCNFKSPLRSDDGDPSCKYYPDTNLVTDFGLGKTVDVFGLVGIRDGIDRFPDQIARVAEILGERVDGSEADNQPRKKPTRPRIGPPAQAGFGDDPMGQYADLMGKMLLRETPGSDDALAYLHGRGFTDGELYRNVIGYVLHKEQFKNDDGTPLFTKYEPNKPKGYIVIPFPADDTFATVHYCMLRAVPGDKPPENKELRPTGCKSPLYREWLLSSGCKVLYIVEGLLDCLAMETLISKPCLALGGTSMQNRVGKILYYTPVELRPQKIVLALDADDAGRKASAKIAADLDFIGIPHADFAMPDGCKDPNDILMQIGGEQ